MTRPPTAAPESVEEAAGLLAGLDDGARVRVLGGGTHQGLGHRFEPDLILSTARLDRIPAWEPDDLTVVAEAGVAVEELEEMLGGKSQTALLPEHPGGGTVGGAVARSASGWRCFRYGPLRDRILEITLVSSDGRVVTAGGRLVKNVTGYDLPRLAAGSFGSLGLIARVCFKLWPLPAAQATVEVESAEEALERTFRPLAVLETEERTTLYLSGTPEEIAGQAAEAGGAPVDGLDWPALPAGQVRFSMRVPPSRLRSMVNRLRKEWRYVAQFGVGEATVGAEQAEAGELAELRGAAEAEGGALVIIEAPAGLRRRFDPWGTPPASLPIQRRLADLLDPGRKINPGVLPGGI